MKGFTVLAADGSIKGVGATGATGAAGAPGTGKLVQVVNTETGAVATGTTLVPFDDTIPQNTEGDQYMTLAITPTSATNKLRIEVIAFVSSGTSGGNWMTAALFQDTTANAVAAMLAYMTVANGSQLLAVTHYMTAGTTSATTFKVRIGGLFAGTTTFNGTAGGRLLGGVMASSITISELVP
jgi:hypothetical protein